MDSTHQTLRRARRAHEKDLTGVAFQVTEQIVCEILLDKPLLYRFSSVQGKKLNNKTISTFRDFMPQEGRSKESL